MKAYRISFKVKNGGEQYVDTVINETYARNFCYSKNNSCKRVGSPNRYYYEEVELINKRS